MARIGRSIFNEWNDGDVIRAKEYNREHEIIRTAINDNFERLIKEVRLLDKDGEEIDVHTLSDLVNFLSLQEGDNIQFELDSENNVIKVSVIQGEGSGLNADLLDGRHRTYFATKTEHDDLDRRFEDHRTSTDHDNRYIPREELEPYLQSGDTLVHYDVFVILESNRGDGTFSYYDMFGEEHIGELDEEGRPIFELSASYSPGNNHIEAYIDDTLHRSSASGGLIEIDETHVMLEEPEENGTEITFRYFQRVGMAEEYSVSFGRDTPRPSTGGTIWFKVVDG